MDRVVNRIILHIFVNELIEQIRFNNSFIPLDELNSYDLLDMKDPEVILLEKELEESS